jgi:hypothetical protein
MDYQMEQDRGYLAAAAPLIGDFILAKDVFWALNARMPAGQPALPQLSIGGLLLVKARLEASGAALPEDALAALGLAQARWRVAWEQKSLREFHTRLVMWSDFLDEYRRKPEEHAPRYGYEVTRRLMMELLAGEAGHSAIPPAEQDLWSGLDHMLKASLQPGEFIWGAALQRGFPAGVYWYLYGRLKGEPSG